MNKKALCISVLALLTGCNGRSSTDIKDSSYEYWDVTYADDDRKETYPTQTNEMELYEIDSLEEFVKTQLVGYSYDNFFLLNTTDECNDYSYDSKISVFYDELTTYYTNAVIYEKVYFFDDGFLGCADPNYILGKDGGRYYSLIISSIFYPCSKKGTITYETRYIDYWILRVEVMNDEELAGIIYVDYKYVENMSKAKIDYMLDYIDRNLISCA